METEDSLPHLQMPATCPYPEPDQSSQFNDTSVYNSASKFRAADSTFKIKLPHVTRVAYCSRSFSWTRARLTTSLPNLIPEIQTLGSPRRLFSNFSPQGSIIIDFLRSPTFSVRSTSVPFWAWVFWESCTALRHTHAATPQTTPPTPIIRRTIHFDGHITSETFKGHEIRNPVSCKVRIRESTESFRAGIRTWYYLKRDVKLLLHISLDNRKIGVRFTARAKGQARVWVPHIHRFSEYWEIFLRAKKPKSETNSSR